MKQTKKVIAMLLALVMVLALGVTAFAQDVDVNQGNGTITVKNAQKDHTYTIYKIFDATLSDDNTKIAYTSTKDLDATGKTWFDSKDIGGGKFEISKKETLTEEQLTAALKTPEFKAWATGYATQISTAKATEATINFNKVPYGYYMVTTTYGAGAISVDSTKPNGIVNEKNNIPSWDNDEGNGKVIINAAGEKVKLDATALGKDIKFDIGVNATNYDREDKIFRYMVQDIVPAGMTYKNGVNDFNVVVSENGVEKPVVKGGTTGYTIKYYIDENFQQETTEVSKARAFKVYVPWTTDNTKNGESLYDNSAQLHVRYTAFLDPDKADKVVYQGANTNRSKFNYWKGTDDNNVEPNHFSPESETKSYVTEVKLLKLDAETKKALEGAEFTLTGDSAKVVYTQGTRFVADGTGGYWKLKDGSYTTTDPATPGISQNLYVSTTQKYRKEDFKASQGENQQSVNISAFVKKDGNNYSIVFSGLGEGKFTLKETVVPAGYNKAADITFELRFDDATETWTVVNGPVTTNQATKQFEISVENKAGTTLPGTGGVGTTVFYVLGSLLVIGAGVILFARKRMGQQEN